MPSVRPRDEQGPQMPIPELELAGASRLLDKFCEGVPVAIRHQLSYTYRVERTTVLLLERRPHFRGASRITEHGIAKFVYSPKAGGWSLRWPDRNGKWHQYDGFENRPLFRDLLCEVENDPTAIFFG